MPSISPFSVCIRRSLVLILSSYCRYDKSVEQLGGYLAYLASQGKVVFENHQWAIKPATKSSTAENRR
jgi:hypothetical protein